MQVLTSNIGHILGKIGVENGLDEFRSTQSLTFEQILKVQKDCHRVLELWGYQVINTKKDLKSVKNPLLKFKLN